MEQPPLTPMNSYPTRDGMSVGSMLPAEVRELETRTCIRIMDAYRELCPNLDEHARTVFKNKLLALLDVIIID